MYKILRSMITDAGPQTEASIDTAISSLSDQVNAAEADGWVPCGGVQVLTRQKPHGLLVWVMQAMALKYPSTLEEVFANSPQGGIQQVSSLTNLDQVIVVPRLDGTPTAKVDATLESPKRSNRPKTA